MTPPANTTQLHVDIAEIKGQLCTLNDIKSSIDGLTRSMSGFREEYIKEHAVLEAKTDKAHTRLDNLESELRTLAETQKEVVKLLPFMRSMLFIVTGVSIPITMAIMYWVWSLITHTTP